MTAQQTKIEAGMQVRHTDGTLGVVTSVQVIGEERIVEWSSCGRRRISGESVLRPVLSNNFRWRRNDSRA